MSKTQAVNVNQWLICQSANMGRIAKTVQWAGELALPRGNRRRFRRWLPHMSPEAATNRPGCLYRTNAAFFSNMLTWPKLKAHWIAVNKGRPTSSSGHHHGAKEREPQPSAAAEAERNGETPGSQHSLPKWRSLPAPPPMPTRPRAAPA